MVDMLIKKAYENIDKYRVRWCTVEGHLIRCECRGTSSDSHKCSYDDVVIVRVSVSRNGNIEFTASKMPRLMKGGKGCINYQISKREAEKLFENCTAITFNDELD